MALLASSFGHITDPTFTEASIHVNDFAPRLDILPPPQRAVWDQLACIPRSFVLYGGTAVALRLAHRTSVDFDFFSNDPFTPNDLLRQLESLTITQRLQSELNTLTVTVGNDLPVKVSFFGGLALRRAAKPDRAPDNQLVVASMLDLAATKMTVVQDRAEQKDYLDIAAIINAGISLEHALGAAKAAYGSTFNPAITLKALVFFDDGDLPALPDHVKQSLASAATNIGTPLDIAPAGDRIDAAAT
jgi:hypothetical protein